MSLDGQRRGERRRREEGVEGSGSGRLVSSGEGGRAAKRKAGDDLAGLSSAGPTWRLEVVGGGGGGDHRLKGCQGLLEQALTCSELADVRFVFEDGLGEVGGHRGWLSMVSEVFAGMFRSGMEEQETGRVRVVGVSRESFRAFLEYLYVGEVGARAGVADGRELWVLAETYQVLGLKEWLVREGVWSMGSACAAMQYAKSAEGSFEELVRACGERACWDLGGATEGDLRGLGAEAASALLAAHCGNERRWRGGDVLEGFRFAERWVRGNGGLEGVGACEVELLVDRLELSKLPTEVLSGTLRSSGLVKAEKVLELCLEVRKQEQKDLLPGGLAFTKAKQFGADLGQGLERLDLACVAVDGKGADQLLAASDWEGHRVVLFNVETGKHVLTIGPQVEGLGELGKLSGLAFNSRGELMVADETKHCIHVMGRDGAYLRSIGREGSGQGELMSPYGLAVGPQGHIIVGDCWNHRIQVLKQDGTFVRAFGSEGSGEGQFDAPCGVAVAVDGSLVVVDHNNARVQVFDAEGVHLRTIGSRGRGAGQFERPYGVCILAGGQIVVSDWEREDAQVFSWEGVYLRSIGKEGDSRVELLALHGVCVDSGGRLFAACQTTGRVEMLSRGAA